MKFNDLNKTSLKGEYIIGFSVDKKKLTCNDPSSNTITLFLERGPKKITLMYLKNNNSQSESFLKDLECLSSKRF